MRIVSCKFILHCRKKRNPLPAYIPKFPITAGDHLPCEKRKVGSGPAQVLFERGGGPESAKADPGNRSGLFDMGIYLRDHAPIVVLPPVIYKHRVEMKGHMKSHGHAARGSIEPSGERRGTLFKGRNHSRRIDGKPDDDPLRPRNAFKRIDPGAFGFELRKCPVFS